MIRYNPHHFTPRYHTSNENFRKHQQLVFDKSTSHKTKISESTTSGNRRQENVTHKTWRPHRKAGKTNIRRLSGGQGS